MSDILDLPYQTEVIQEIVDFDHRVLLALDMGLGKTSCSLRAMQRNPDAYPVLIVCPSVVKYNWQREAARFIGQWASVCEGRRYPGKGGPLDDHFDSVPKIMIINPDILKYWMPYLETIDFHTLIVDECQLFKDSSKQRTKALKKIARDVRYMYALSGTPLLNKPYEMWPILNMLWPDIYASSWEFSQQFCGPKYTRWGWDHSGATNLDKLNRDLLRIGMIRRKKSEVLKDLPDKIWRTIPCELSDMAEYREASRDFLGWLKKNMAHRVTSASQAEKLTRIGYLLRLIGKLKSRNVVRWANRFLDESGEKLILFCVNQKMVDVLQRRIEVPSVVLDTNTAGKDRQRIVDSFQNDDRIRLFIGTGAAGVGINLTAASEVGIAQFPWRPADLMQWVDRSHRLGQKQTVFCNFLIAVDTLEEDLCKLLHTKAKVISAVLDGGQDSTDVNVYEELLAVIEGTL